jgi:hypothetical protein
MVIRACQMPDGSCHPPAVPRVRRNREARFLLLAQDRTWGRKFHLSARRFARELHRAIGRLRSYSESARVG